MTEDVHSSIEHSLKQANRELNHDESIHKPLTEESGTDVLTPSRKRDREISLEPLGSTQQRFSEPQQSVSTPTAVPTKKNRLGTPMNGDSDNSAEPDSPSTPPLSNSPPHESKVRQISQKVEDLNWKEDTQKTKPDLTIVDVSPERGTEEIATSEQTAHRDIDPVNGNSETSAENEENTSAELNVPEDAPPRPQTPTTSTVDDMITSPAIVSSPRDGSSTSRRKLTDPSYTYIKVENDTKSAAEAAKRPRDDPEEDANPRAVKRPSPPPTLDRSSDQSGNRSPVRRPASPKSNTTLKASGFMSFASKTSPFGTKKGSPSVFHKPSSSVDDTPSLISKASTSSLKEGVLKPAPVIAESSTSEAVSESESTKPSPAPSIPAAGSGFAAFATKNPFAVPTSPGKSTSILRVGRSKSPGFSNSGTNAFASYAAAGGKFSTRRTARQGSPASSAAASEGEEEDISRSRTFTQRLRNSKDHEQQQSLDEEDSRAEFVLQEQLKTGEENEDTATSVRGKLYVLNESGQWKERGTGNLKLNVNRDSNDARLIMRKEAVHTLLLNCPLFHGMNLVLAQDPRYVRFSAIESGQTKHYNLRVPNARLAQDLLEVVDSYIPSPPGDPGEV